MNLQQVTKLPIAFCAQQWFALLRRTRFCKLSLLFSFLAVHSGSVVTLGAPLVGADAAEAAFAAGRYTEALPYFQGVLNNKLSSDKELSVANCRVGIIKSIQGDNVTARSHLELSLNAHILSGKALSICSYALLQVYAILEAYKEARQFVPKMGELILPGAYKARAEALAVEVGTKINDSSFTMRHIHRLLKIMDENKMLTVEVKVIGKTFSREELGKKLDSLRSENKSQDNQIDDGLAAPISAGKSPKRPVNSESMSESSSARSLLSSNDTSFNERVVTLPEELSFLRGMREGQDEETAESIRWRLKADSAGTLLAKSGLSSQLVRLSNRLQKLAKTSPKHLRVGVLITAGSSYARYKHKILRSLSAFASSEAAKGVRFSFVVRPVATEMGNIEETVLGMLLEDGVSAVVGTLTGNQALAALTVCEQFSVPLFSIGPVSNAPELRSKNHIRMGVLAISQANAHVRHLKELKFKTAAILAPNDTYGVEMAAAFRDVATENELKVVSVTFFDINKQDFQEPVKLVLGPQGRQAYPEEFEALAKEHREKAEKEKRKFDPSVVKMPAILNFQALYVPDALLRAKLIATTFAFNEAKNVRYLGDRTWAEEVPKPSIADQFLNGSRGLLFEEGSFAGYLRSSLRINEPSLDLERQVFDSMILLRQAQFKAKDARGVKLINAMREPGFSAEGTTKISGILPNGEPNTSFGLGSLKNGRVLRELSTWPMGGGELQKR